MIKKNFIILLIFIFLWQCKGRNVLEKEQLLEYGISNYEENYSRYKEIVEIILNTDVSLNYFMIDYLVKSGEVVVLDKKTGQGETDLFSKDKQERLESLFRQDDLTLIVRKNQYIRIRLDYRNISFNYLNICYLYPDFNIYEEFKNFEVLSGKQKPTQNEKWLYIINKNWILYVP